MLLAMGRRDVNPFHFIRLNKVISYPVPVVIRVSFGEYGKFVITVSFTNSDH
jgi:hypothetical protein